MTKQQIWDKWLNASLFVHRDLVCEFCNRKIKDGSYFRRKLSGNVIHESCLELIGKKLKKENQP